MHTLAPDLSHSRFALACVVAAHVAITWAAVDLIKRKPPVELEPLTVALLHEELPVDQAPQPLPMAPKSPPPRPIPKEPPPEVKQIEPPPPEVERKPPELPPPPEPVHVAETPPPVEPPPQMPPAPQAITTPALPQVVAVAPPTTAAVTVRAPPPQEEIAPVFNAAYLNNPTPVYPPVSRKMGEQGLVLLRVLVNAKGDPNAVELKAGCGYARLDRAAQEAVKQWKFVPAKRGEQPVDAWVVVPIRFSLKG